MPGSEQDNVTNRMRRLRQRGLERAQDEDARGGGDRHRDRGSRLSALVGGLLERDAVAGQERAVAREARHPSVPAAAAAGRPRANTSQGAGSPEVRLR